MKLRLDTLNKKPKVWSIAVLSAAFSAALALLFTLGGAGVARYGCLLMSLFFLAVTGLLIRAFFLQMRYNLYSYNTIIYFGFALFTIFCAASGLQLFFLLRGVPAEFILSNLIGRLLRTGKSYALITSPFLICFSGALVVSNLSLIRHEGFRPVNLLGVVLAILLVAGNVTIFLLDDSVSGSMTEVMLRDLLTNLLAAVYLYFECMLLGTMAAGAIAARYEPEPDRDFIIVPGCAIRRDGTPTPLLRGRLDRALHFAEGQQSLTDKAPVFVLSGGQGSDECVSEAECMRRYLESKGVPADRMILEDRSENTAQNMLFSKELILAEKPDAKIAFSTTNYHVFRSGLKARRVKMRALGMGCPSKWYFWPNAAVREFAGLLTQHRGKQGLILLGLVLVYTALTLLHYRL